MAFPYAPVDLVGEIYVGGQWLPVQLPESPLPGNQVRRQPITITRGSANEQSKPGPSKCTLRLGNRDGRYSPRYPLSPYFGQLQRNTPLRLAIRRERDLFNRIVSNSWGSATTGEPWTTGGSAGVVVGDFGVDGTYGTHSVPSTTNFRYSYLTNSLYQDADLGVTFQLDSVTNITGGDLEPANIMFRGRSTSDYFMVRVVINSSEEVSVALHHVNGTIYHSAETALTGWAGEPVRVRALIEDQSVRVKVWRPNTETEPYDWILNAFIGPSAPYFGWVGVRSGVGGGNTNTKPVKFKYSNWEVRIPRFTGEITKWPQQTHKSGKDAFVSIEASGLLRRLGQGSSPLRSTMYRGITTAATTPVAYWPVEEGRFATSIASGLRNGAPMRIDGTPAFATFSDITSTAALPELRKSAWTGDVAPYTAATGDVQVRWLIRVPSGGTVDQDVITRVFCNGTVKFVDVMYHVGGNLSVKAYNAAGAQVFDTGVTAFAVNGKNLRMQLDLDQVGSNVSITIAILEVGAESGGFWNQTLNSHTIGQATQVVINPYKNLDTVALGHISVSPVITSLFDLYQQLNAYRGEASGVRIQRLCDENGIPFDAFGDLSATEPMGPQRPDTFLNLINECAAVDMGTIYEPRGVIGLVYRTRRMLENQTPVLTTSYRNLTPPGDPVDDDQATRNNVTVTRKDGSFATAVQETGPLSILPPEQGGVGLYDTNVTVNCWTDTQLPYFAGWLRHLGTIDEARYPQLQIDLAAKAFAASAVLTAAVLALSVDDRIVLSNPPDGQAPDDISQLTRGFTERIEPWAHSITTNCAPESPYQVMVLDDANARLAPAADCALAASYVAGAGSVSVASPTGPAWTTDAGQMPITIRAAGENMTTSAITGASSPQTFTVGRAANGVSKPQTSGTTVTLANQPVLAL